MTDQKLVNTAITRAQSFIGVVGDPVALCSIGQCAAIWRSYIKQCESRQTISPPDLTLDDIKMECQTLECQSHREDEEDETPHVPLELLDWDATDFCKPDGILCQLARQASLQEKSADVTQSNPSTQSVEQPLTIECIRLKEDQGHAVVYYNSMWPRVKTRERRKLLSADDAGKNYDSDSDSSDLQPERSSIGTQDLTNLLQQQPDKYKRCVLHAPNPVRIIAKAKDDSSQEILIGGRKRSGHALHNDEVVVEVFSLDKDDDVFETNNDRASGKVVGILKRANDPRYRMFVCTADVKSNGFMVPLNPGMPKMMAVTTKDKVQKKHFVCIYQFTKDAEILFDHLEPIDTKDPQARKLFLVRYLKWEEKFHQPLCVVVGTIPEGRTLEKGLDILNVEHFIHRSFNEQAREEAEAVQMHPDPQRQLDLRQCLAFTIDPPGSKDLDDALSLVEEDGAYKIGIHIADVSRFVPIGGAVDLEAKKRCTTFYASGQPAGPMLPESLSTDACSLKKGQDRFVISVLVTTDTAGKISKWQVARSVIKSQYQLTYKQVEDILKGQTQHDNLVLTTALTKLHKIAKTWRRDSRGNEGVFHGCDDEGAMTPEAHILVEEMMLKANHLVAGYLLTHYKQTTPLRVQSPPGDKELEEWTSNFATVASTTLQLKQPFLPPKTTCTCISSCGCMGNVTRPAKVKLVEEKLHGILQSSPDNVYSIVNPQNIPEVMVATFRLWKIMGKASYSCSGELKQHGHYSLRADSYTHFTSPIRRYIDLLVHRLVTAALLNQPCPYAPEELSSMCTVCTDASQRASQYDQRTEELRLATLLETRPMMTCAVVESINERMINLSIPSLKYVSSRDISVQITKLQPASQPILTEQSSKIYWKERIYDAESQKEHVQLARPRDIPRHTDLNPDSHTVAVDYSVWQQLIFAAAEGDSNRLEQALSALRNEVQNRPSPQIWPRVSSEVLDITHSSQWSNYSLPLSPGSMLTIQVSADVKKGLLTPKTQLVELTPEIDICLEHRCNPQRCFANKKAHKASKLSYKSLTEYQELWSTLTAIEAAHASVQAGERAIIQNVPIKWKKRDEHTLGVFRLNKDFCEARRLEFHRPDEDDSRSYDTQALSDYFCVRYKKMQRPQSLAEKDMPLPFLDHFTWVGHFVSVNEAKKDDDKIEITLRLYHSTAPFPDVLMDTSRQLATVEFIQKLHPNCREELAIEKIVSASPLAKAIALGKSPPPLEESEESKLRELQLIPVPTQREPNNSQKAALAKALMQPFTLIQGPPGTGKTVTGVRLAYLFSHHNSQYPGEPRPQVMYCGPSNKSVDVVTEHLMKIQKEVKVKVVRAYSSMIEQEDFPMPIDAMSHTKRSRHDRNSAINQVSLHHMIRHPNCSNAREIRKFDMKIQACREVQTDLTEEEKKQYQDLINEAKEEVLKKADIVLCTCHFSYSICTKFPTNFCQVIIDECGMCTEPASMIPIVKTKARQVVLIGDHKQLRPIIVNNMAKEMGLETSLFERYHKSAIMLTIQYRMHQAIAEFPSVHFYDGKLQTGNASQRTDSELRNFWSNGRNKPIMFLHIVGKDECQVVATAEGSENSRHNKEEAAKAAQVAFHLINNYRVHGSRVTILSQYKAQVHTIKKCLADKGLNTEVKVSTVVEAQGSECDYIIISLVRSLPKSQLEVKPSSRWTRMNLGFITDEHQMNVALTRAKKGLIIIGNQNLLSCNRIWKKLLDHYRNNKKLLEGTTFP